MARPRKKTNTAVKAAANVTAAKATEVVKAVEETAEAAVETAETAVETAAEAVETKAEKAATAVKKTAKKAPAKKEKEPAKTTMILQFGSNAEANLSSLEEKIKAQFVEEGHRAGCIRNLDIYVKPEEGKAYYVINDGKFTGSVYLF